MKTECNSSQVEFEGFGRRKLVASFDAEHITSDGGLVLLERVDRQFGVLHRFANCFVDHRNPEQPQAVSRSQTRGPWSQSDHLPGHGELTLQSEIFEGEP